MVELYGRSLSRRDVDARSGALAAVRRRPADDARRRRRARHPHARVPHRHRPALHRARRPRARHRRLRLQGPGDRLALAGRLPPSRPARVRGRGRASPGCARSPASSPPAASTTSSAAPRCRPTTTTTRAARRSRHSLHGRVSTIPARLTGYGETWDGDRCLLWAEGIVQQSTVFGEDLHLIRRIEADVGGNAIRIADRVVNHGFYRTPHMFFYHVNVGWPLLEEGARYLAPIRDVVWASHADEPIAAQGVGYRSVPAPRHGFREQVWQHELAADAGGEVPGRGRQRPARPRLRGRDPQGPAALPLPVAELPGRALRAWNRALDAPRPRQPRGARARRDDLAGARREPVLRR